MKNNFPSLCGKFLIAMPSMGDARFEKSVIYVCAHSDEGAMGFVVNKAMSVPTVPDFLEQLEIINEDERKGLAEQVNTKVLQEGGPVEPGRGFVLHTQDFSSEHTVDVSKSVCLTATLEILRAIAMGKGPASCLMVLGYSGWGAGQLEDEIASNGWLTVDANDEILFDASFETKYHRSLGLLGVDETLLSSDTGHA